MTTPTTVMPQRSIARVTALILATRLVASTSAQIFFPFLPFIASGLAITEIQLGRLLGINGLTTIFSPIFGTVADKRGYRRTIQVALLITSIGCLLIYVSSTLSMFIVGLLLMGVGFGGLNPVLSAYMSHLLPFERRSRGLGMLEYSWALASLVVLPLFGLLIGVTSWRLPFLILTIATVGTALAFSQLPGTGRARQPLQFSRTALIVTLRDFFNLGSNWRSGVATLSADSFIKFSGISLAITFGTWLAREYGLTPANLGQVAFVLGLADISGSGFISLFGDRLGKRRSALVSTGLGAILFATLPLWNFSFVTALIGLFLARWTFELSIVSNIVLVSEQNPAQRGKLLSMRIGLGFLAIFLASTLGPVLYDSYGIWGVALPGALSMATAWCIFNFYVVERGYA